MQRGCFAGPTHSSGLIPPMPQRSVTRTLAFAPGFMWAGALSRIGAGSVLGHTARRWNHGPYVRSVTASPLANGDLKVTVADVHLWSAINRRLR